MVVATSYGYGIASHDMIARSRMRTRYSRYYTRICDEQPSVFGTAMRTVAQGMGMNDEYSEEGRRRYTQRNEYWQLSIKFLPTTQSSVSSLLLLSTVHSIFSFLIMSDYEVRLKFLVAQDTNTRIWREKQSAMNGSHGFQGQYCVPEHSYYRKVATYRFPNRVPVPSCPIQPRQLTLSSALLFHQ
jgi:hypothetical protein